jgi:hypothetical protein
MIGIHDAPFIGLPVVAPRTDEGSSMECRVNLLLVMPPDSVNSCIEYPRFSALNVWLSPSLNEEL